MVDFKKLSKNPEEMKKIDEWTRQYFKQLEIEKLHEREIISNDDYIDWLIKFTEEYPCFSDDSWLYCPEEISDENRKKVSILSNFFKVIDDYANMNYLPNNETDFGYTYCINHNGVNLEVGMAIGQGTIFYVSRKEDDLENVIEFRNIQKGEKTERAQKIDGIFTKLESVLGELSEEKVSSETILIKTKNILKEKR